MREALLVCSDVSGFVGNEDFAWRIKLYFLLLFLHFLCVTDIDNHLATGFNLVSHVLQNICTPIIGNNIEYGIGDYHVIFALYIFVFEICGLCACFGRIWLYIFNVESHIAQCLSTLAETA